MNNKTTEQLQHEIKESCDIQDFLASNRRSLLHDSFPEYLNKLLSEKGLHKKDIIRASQLDRVYVYQIFAGRKFPSRNKLLALAFGMQLSAEETQKLLKISGNRELYARDPRDAVVLFALQREMSIADANELLYRNAFKLLGDSQR